MAELDDWGLSAEELDFLEKDAINKLSQKNPSCSSSYPASRNLEPSPSISTSQDSRYAKIEGASPSPSRSHATRENGDRPKLSVRLYLHPSGVLAAKFPYHALLVEAFHKIPKASWHGKERVWMFPNSSLSTAEEVLSGVSGLEVEVQKLDTLVCRALAAANAAPDLRGAQYPFTLSSASKEMRKILYSGSRMLN